MIKKNKNKVLPVDNVSEVQLKLLVLMNTGMRTKK